LLDLGRLLKTIAFDSTQQRRAEFQVFKGHRVQSPRLTDKAADLKIPV
jgi:hypothetical protein